ncbi:hypothetical protein F0L68_39290 [Solihabitans fulvus]|uniref:Uncharacterized protein n=1 Tax=Solihabitans fulvus TaxID=1892852 RepID=A0A5B2WC24_9PSEU|nr:hypothetical protein F0L68_39290 [Solihabitans fulvus]
MASRLNDLFATVAYVDRGRRREYSTPYVAKAITDDPTHDTTVSRVYLNSLRNGSNTNPTISVLRAVAKFFDEHRQPGAAPITAAYLLGDEDGDDAEERELRTMLANHQVRAIAMRAGSMNPTMLRQVLAVIDALESTSNDPLDDVDRR